MFDGDTEKLPDFIMLLLVGGQDLLHRGAQGDFPHHQPQGPGPAVGDLLHLHKDSSLLSIYSSFLAEMREVFGWEKDKNFWASSPLGSRKVSCTDYHRCYSVIPLPPLEVTSCACVSCILLTFVPGLAAWALCLHHLSCVTSPAIPVHIWLLSQSQKTSLHPTIYWTDHLLLPTASCLTNGLHRSSDSLPCPCCPYLPYMD